jgi:hypothetical protein
MSNLSLSDHSVLLTVPLVLLKLPSCLHYRFLLHIVFETALNLSENIALISLESYACKHVDLEQLWGQECQVVIISLPGSVLSPSGECIWFTHALAWLVVKLKVEAI